jgi:hypothetical protein
VVISQGTIQNTAIGGYANPSNLTNNAPYALSALTLMKSVGLA